MGIRHTIPDTEDQALLRNEEKSTSAPVTLHNDHPNDQSHLKSQKRDFQKLRRRCAKFAGSLGKTAPIVLFSFSTIMSIVVFIISFNEEKPEIEVYIPRTVDIEKLTPQGQARHRLDYEKSFYETPFMKKFSEISNAQTKDYYKDYAYIKNSHNLSLYANVPANSYSSVATLIDRSVTNKSIKNIYKDYDNAIDLNTLNHDFYQQQPVHRLTDMEPLYYYHGHVIHTNLGEYVSFLTQFIILFGPVNNEQNDYLSLQSDREKLSKLVFMAIKPAGNNGGGSNHSALTELVIISTAGEIYLLFNLMVIPLIVGVPPRIWLNWMVMVPVFLNTIVSIAFLSVIASYNIFEVYEAAKPFSQLTSIGNLDWLMRRQRFYYFEMVRNLFLLFLYSLTFFDPDM